MVVCISVQHKMKIFILKNLTMSCHNTKRHLFLKFLVLRLWKKLWKSRHSVLKLSVVNIAQNRRENIKVTYYGIQSVKFLGPNIWGMVPQNIKNCKFLQEFKKLIKVWKPEACPCRMCKKYVANIVFIWLSIHLS